MSTTFNTLQQFVNWPLSYSFLQQIIKVNKNYIQYVNKCTKHWYSSYVNLIPIEKQRYIYNRCCQASVKRWQILSTISYCTISKSPTQMFVKSVSHQKYTTLLKRCIILFSISQTCLPCGTFLVTKQFQAHKSRNRNVWKDEHWKFYLKWLDYILIWHIKRKKKYVELKK